MGSTMTGALVAALTLIGAGAASAQPAPWADQAHVPAYACVRDFWVDPVHGGVWTAYADGGGDRAHPWRSLQDADQARRDGRPVLGGGDCVNLLPGRYELAHGLRLTHGGARNAPDGWLVYRAATPGTAHLVATAPLYGLIDIKAAYLILDGLELDGGDALAGGEGVGVSGEASHHHIVVEHCRIHGMGGGGVQLNDSEYFWVVDNEIWGNASTNRYQESGISTYQARAASDLAPTPADDIPFHIVILGNYSHDNVETFPCDGRTADTARPGCHTDGNGIIIDKTRNVDRPGGTPYAGRVLVADNLVSGNGGGGAHLYLSQHVTVAGNVAMNDHVDRDNGGTWRGELSDADADDNIWIGNVGWAMAGPGVLAHNSAVLEAVSQGQPAGVTWRGNTTCGGDRSVYAHAPGLDPAANTLDADPRVCRQLADQALAHWRATTRTRTAAATP